MRLKNRLTKPYQFLKVRQIGRSYNNNLLLLYALPNDLPISRFGFVVNKRMGNAIIRNRIKRWLREASRILLKDIALGWDLVLVVKKETRNRDFTAIKDSLEDLIKKIGLLKINVKIGTE